MPEITLEIGGRNFSLACDPGEEASLKMAAEMLADRTKEMETACQLSDTRLKTLEDRLLENEAKLAAMTVEMNKTPEPPEEDLFSSKVAISESLAKSVAKLEAMIDTSA
jgi:cell division protein ZapA